MDNPNLAPSEEGERMEETDAVGVIFEDSGGNILVLKRHPDRPEAKTWGLVGGKVNPGEDIYAAAIREASEEIGYNIPASELSFRKTYNWTNKDGNFTFGVFKYPVLQESIDVKLKDDESTQFMWATPQQLHQRQDLMEGLYPILEEEFDLNPTVHTN